MAIENVLMKIESVTLGSGGYQGAMFGVSFTFSTKSTGIGTFWGAWGGKRSDHAKWTEQDRLNQLGEMCLKIDKLLTEAKVSSLDKLKGIPVEVTIENNTFKDFRILTEVL